MRFPRFDILKGLLMDIIISWFDHMHDAVPKMEATSWAKFADRLSELAQTERSAEQKANSPLVSAAVYAEGGRRNNQDVIGFGRWFAIDIDKGKCSLQAASGLCRDAEVSHVIWTTTNHTDDLPRFRIAFPLDRDVERYETALFWQGAHIWFKEWGDVATKDPARLMIAPARWRATAPIAAYSDVKRPSYFISSAMQRRSSEGLLMQSIAAGF